MQVNCGKINKYITEIEKKTFFENCGNAMCHLEWGRNIGIGRLQQPDYKLK